MTNPLCCPSRATFLTGQYAHNHGVEDYYDLDGSTTLPVWFKRSGYVTGHIGKYLNGYGTRDPLEVPAGWTEWYGSVDWSTYRMYGYTLNENGGLHRYGGRGQDYQTDVYANKAVDFVHRHAAGGSPFFLSVNPLAPHREGEESDGFLVGPQIERNPRPAPRHHRVFEDRRPPRPPSFDEPDVSDKPGFVRKLPRIGATQRRRITAEHRSRLEALLGVDDLIRRVVTALKNTGELKNTVIVFTSDNGWLQGEHRIPRGKTKLYEESVRVPLIIRGPGFPRGSTRRQLVGNVDLAPTILDVTDVGSGGQVLDGRSLLAPAQHPRSVGRFGLLLENRLGSEAVRTTRFSYIEHAGNEKELYDLREDPFQLTSLHERARYRGTQGELRRYLHRLRDCAGRSCTIRSH